MIEHQSDMVSTELEVPPIVSSFFYLRLGAGQSQRKGQILVSIFDLSSPTFKKGATSFVPSLTFKQDG